ncbi:MAG: hypothetical protein V9G12_18330 [Microthrixaceae bacterium]
MPALGAVGPERRPSLLRTDTPGRMRVWSIAVAVVTVIFGIVGSTAIANRATDLGDARDAAAQLERLESVRTAVVEADSLAASAYLEGGLESPDRRATYEDRLDAAQAGLAAAAARATDAEVEQLGGLASALTMAAGLIEQSRANSRQGFPVGAAYQRNASALIRSDVLPGLDSIATATAARTGDEVDRGARAQLVLWGPALVALALIGAAAVWLTRRTRRVVNVGLAIAALAVLGFTGFASSVLASSTSDARSTLDGSYAGATAFAQARTAAFDARSNEALTLIARGNGAAFETRWQEQAAQVAARLTDAAKADSVNGQNAIDGFRSYGSEHVQVLDDAGDYDTAVERALAVGNGGDGFFQFDEASRTGLESLSADTDAALGEARDSVSGHRWLVLVAGFVAAAAAFAGFARRIQEYR